MSRYEKVKVASILGIILNFFLCLIKGFIGIISGSQSMLADAFNSGGDIFTSLITYVGNKIASKPIDDDHDLGHGKAEYIYALLISVIMIIASFKILIDSIKCIFIPNHYQFSWWLIIVCLITIIIKLSLFLYTNKISKEENNLLIKAVSIDHRNDAVITTLNLFAIILTIFNIYFFDGLVASFISLWIIWTSFNIFKESYDVLMDKSIGNITKEKVYEIVKSHKEIKKTNHFNSTPIGYKYQISLTIFVDGNLSTYESHKIADNLEKEIIKKVPEIYLAVIHVNPWEKK